MTTATITFGSGGIGDSDVAATAGIDYTKVNHLQSINVELAEQGTEIAAIEKLIYLVRGANATILTWEGAFVSQGVTSGTVNVDLQRSTGGGAFASITTTDIVLEYNDTALVPVAATLSTTALVDGDILKAVVSVSGGGTYPSGLICTLNVWEKPA